MRRELLDEHSEMGAVAGDDLTPSGGQLAPLPFYLFPHLVRGAIGSYHHIGPLRLLLHRHLRGPAGLYFFITEVLKGPEPLLDPCLRRPRNPDPVHPGGTAGPHAG